MPTYTVHAATGRLDARQKQRIAEVITRAHNEVTGAQTFFAQVIFLDMPQGDWYVAGHAVKADQVYVHGQIRGGRTKEMKTALIERLLGDVSQAAGIRRNQCWVYIIDLVPSFTAEYGNILPEPGTESQWLANLRPEDRELMESTARGA
jgi:phenylpyruvate tautomerase PptA (4-oxalocrotonate tautomerase family)